MAAASTVDLAAQSYRSRHITAECLRSPGLMVESVWAAAYIRLVGGSNRSRGCQTDRLGPSVDRSVYRSHSTHLPLTAAAAVCQSLQPSSFSAAEGSQSDRDLGVHLARLPAAVTGLEADEL